MFLKELSRGYLVGKDPDAPLFYREEGNKKFQEKDYVGATVLYTKVRHSQLNGMGLFQQFIQAYFLKCPIV